jgi:hypothetical protein
MTKDSTVNLWARDRREEHIYTSSSILSRINYQSNSRHAWRSEITGVPELQAAENQGE